MCSLRLAHSYVPKSLLTSRKTRADDHKQNGGGIMIEDSKQKRLNTRREDETIEESMNKIYSYNRMSYLDIMKLSEFNENV